MKPLIVLVLSLIYLALSILCWVIWPLVAIRVAVGEAFTLLNFVGLIIFFWRRRSRKKNPPRPQPHILLKIATFVWFLSIFIFIFTSIFGGNSTYYVKNTIDYKNTRYLLVVSSTCFIDCYISFHVYRCMIGDFICPPMDTLNYIPYDPNLSPNGADVSLGIDSKTGELNLLNKGEIIQRIE